MVRELSNITFNSSLITRIFEAVRVQFIDKDGGAEGSVGMPIHRRLKAARLTDAAH